MASHTMSTPAFTNSSQLTTIHYTPRWPQPAPSPSDARPAHLACAPAKTHQRFQRNHLLPSRHAHYLPTQCGSIEARATEFVAHALARSSRRPRTMPKLTPHLHRLLRGIRLRTPLVDLQQHRQGPEHRRPHISHFHQRASRPRPPPHGTLRSQHGTERPLTDLDDSPRTINRSRDLNPIRHHDRHQGRRAIV